MSDTLKAQVLALEHVEASAASEVATLEGTLEVIRADRASMARELELVEGFLSSNEAVATGSLLEQPDSLRVGIQKLDGELAEREARLEVVRSTRLNARTERKAIEKYLREEAT